MLVNIFIQSDIIFKNVIIKKKRDKMFINFILNKSYKSVLFYDFKLIIYILCLKINLN